jgi:hypothetical protein
VPIRNFENVPNSEEVCIDYKWETVVGLSYDDVCFGQQRHQGAETTSGPLSERYKSKTDDRKCQSDTIRVTIRFAAHLAT